MADSDAEKARKEALEEQARLDRERAAELKKLAARTERERIEAQRAAEAQEKREEMQRRAKGWKELEDK